jgi:hypothetical protein
MMRDRWFWAAVMVACVVVALIWSAIWQGLEPPELRAKEHPPLRLPAEFNTKAQTAWDRLRPLYGDFAMPPIKCRTEGEQKICQPEEPLAPPHTDAELRVLAQRYPATGPFSATVPIK